jgi:phosphate transporter
MLLLGGYTLSSAFSRCQLELRAAAWMQKKFGHSPLKFLLAVMYLGLFLSMWISNHTAPILCCTMLLPLVRDLPKDSK